MLGWAAVATMLVEGAVRGIGILHALIAPVFFSIIVAIAVFTSPGWRQEPELVDDPWQPPLRSVAVVFSGIGAAAIALGAGYRHNVIGVIWHIMNAMLVWLATLVVGSFPDEAVPEHRVLFRTGRLFVIITSVQVLVGFGTFIVLLLSLKSTLPIAIASVLHVAIGAMTLAGAVVLAIQVRANMRATYMVTLRLPTEE